MKKIVILSLAATIALASCTKKLNEENLPLRLDFPAEDTHQIADDVQAYTVHTDELTVSFDILSGAGGYTAQVMENDYIASRQITLPGGTARIEGKTVTVDLLDDAVDVVVSDLSGAESHVYIYSSHPAVQHFSWSKCVPCGGAVPGDSQAVAVHEHPDGVGVKDAVEEGEEVADGIEADGSGDEVFREEVRGRWNAVPFFAEPGGCLRCCRGGVRSGGGRPGRSGR